MNEPTSRKIYDLTKPLDQQPDTRETLEMIADNFRVPGPPKTIITYFEGSTLQDFIRQNVVAAALTKRFLGAYVLGVFRNDPVERVVVADCNPYVHGSIAADINAPMTIPLDWFGHGQLASVRCPDPEWYSRKFSEPDLFFLPSMLTLNAARLDGLAEAPPTFRLPETAEAALLSRLEGLGLRRDRWFACLHVSDLEKSYVTTSQATVDGSAYLPMIENIVHNQGGQIVCLGTPKDTALPKMEGVLDFCDTDLTFLEKVAAVSLARYVIGTEGWPVAMASAFRTPVAATNVLEFGSCVWNQEDIVLAKRITRSDGKLLNSREALEAGYLEGTLPDDVLCHDVTSDELIAVSNTLFEKTKDCGGWRPKPEEISSEPMKYLTFPLPMRERPLLEFWT